MVTVVNTYAGSFIELFQILIQSEIEMRVLPDSQNDNPLKQFFQNKDGRVVNKWMHYFDVYHNHFDRFRSSSIEKITMLEIGVARGGSLEMWRNYFGSKAHIIGVDVNPDCKKFEENGIDIRIGDQADPKFLQSLIDEFGNFDILIDDGGHTMVQQHVTFDILYPKVNENGIFLVEDLHTSYWYDWDAGRKVSGSFIERAKGLIDSLNAHHSRSPDFSPDDITLTATGIHFYDSVMVIEKCPNPRRSINAHSG